MTIVNSDNKFGTNRFVVSTIPGEGGFTSIQDAIDAANVAGGGTVVLMQGTYNEDITLANQVFLYGLTTPQNFNIIINGTLTITDQTGNSGITNLSLQATGSNNAIEINCTVPGTPSFFINNCSVSSNSAVGILSSATSGAQIGITAQNSSITGGTYAFDLSGSCGIAVNYGNITAGTAMGNFSDNCVGQVFYSTGFSAGQGFIINNVANSLTYVNSFGSFAQELVNFVAAGSATVANSGFACSSGSGNWATGAAGTLIYGGVLVLGSSGIAGTLTANTGAILPRATSGTSGTAVKGSSGFDSSDFSVTDGFVSLSGTGSLNRQTITTSGSLSVNNGYYVTSGSLSLSLPATSAIGDVIQVTLAGGTSWTITQGAGQQIQVGSALSTLGAGGNLATSTNGDSVLLECYVANTIWIATSIIGNLAVT